MVYKSGLGIFISPKGAKLAFSILNPNLARSAPCKNARLRVSDGMRVLVGVILIYKSDLGIYISPLGAKLANLTSIYQVKLF